jgi:predicted DNA-binding transcriptional regulator AlpA
VTTGLIVRRPPAPKAPERYSMTASEVAALIGISVTSFWHLRNARADFPRPVPPLWPGGRPLWDRGSVERWWRARVRQAQQREARA